MAFYAQSTRSKQTAIRNALFRQIKMINGLPDEKTSPQKKSYTTISASIIQSINCHIRHAKDEVRRLWACCTLKHTLCKLRCALSFWPGTLNHRHHFGLCSWKSPTFDHHRQQQRLATTVTTLDRRRFTYLSSSSTAGTGNDCDYPGQKELYIFIIIINSKDLRWLWPPWTAALHFYHQRQQQSLVTTVINLNIFIIIVNSRDWRWLWLTWTIWQNGLHRYTAFLSLYVVLAPSKPLIQRIREMSIFKAEFWHRIHSNHFSVPRVHTSYIYFVIYI